MHEQALPFVLGVLTGLVVGLILQNIFFVKAIKTAKDKEEAEDDWWKKGEPPPWDKE